MYRLPLTSDLLLTVKADGGPGASGWQRRPRWPRRLGGSGIRNRPPNGLDVQNGFEGPQGKGGSITVNLRPPSRAVLERYPSLQPLWPPPVSRRPRSPLSGNSRSHSYRKTTTGSTPIARRAGTAQATSAMPPSKAITAVNTSGSNGRVP